MDGLVIFIGHIDVRVAVRLDRVSYFIGCVSTIMPVLFPRRGTIQPARPADQLKDMSHRQRILRQKGYNEGRQLLLCNF